MSSPSDWSGEVQAHTVTSADSYVILIRSDLHKHLPPTRALWPAGKWETSLCKVISYIIIRKNIAIVSIILDFLFLDETALDRPCVKHVETVRCCWETRELSSIFHHVKVGRENVH